MSVLLSSDPGTYVGVFTDKETGFPFALYDHSTSQGGIDQFYANYNKTNHTAHTDDAGAAWKRSWLDCEGLSNIQTACCRLSLRRQSCKIDIFCRWSVYPSSINVSLRVRNR